MSRTCVTEWLGPDRIDHKWGLYISFDLRKSDFRPVQTVYDVELNNNSMTETDGGRENSLYYFVPGVICNCFI